jgi:hypothetical protein
VSNKKSKKDLVLIHLQMHNTITSWEAIQKFKATRLSDIIYRLKKEGHNISVVKKYNRETETNFAEYRLLSNDDNGQIGFI